MRLNHIALRVKNIETMLHFYCDQLGCKEAFKILNDDQTLRIVYVHISDGQYIELCLNGTTRPDFDDQHSLGVRHVCFTVDDIQKTREELTQKGVIFDSEILSMRDNNLAMYLFDPEGNKIEIVQTGIDSPQYAFEKTWNLISKK